MTDHDAFKAREDLGLFNVTLQSPFFTWLWAQSERRRHQER